MIMRQPAPASQDILQPKAERCACGGSCPRCREHSPLQTKLAVGEPGDAYEREADRIADQVLATPAHPVVDGAPPRIQRFAGQATGQAAAAPPSVDQVLASPGRPLEPVLRQDMEQRFGHDLSRVRVHSGAAAERSARDVNAQAYTVGRDIVFSAGQYAPVTSAGRRMIAHELVHVVQQSKANAPGTVQRQAGGGTPAGGAPAGGAPAGGAPAPATGPALSVKYNGCARPPYTLATIQAAAQAAYNAVLTTNCIRSPALRNEILSEFSQLIIDCEQGDSSDPCGRAMYVFSHTANLFPDSLTATCGPLESTLLHEVVHLTEVRLWGHGDLAGACEASCFGWGSGDPAKCTDEGKVRHGPSFALGLGSGATGTGAFGRVGYDVVKSWVASSFSLGLRLDVPLSDRESFVRAGLEVGANHQLLGSLYGRLFTGLSVPWPPGSRPPSLYLGAGLGLDLGRTQLELLYDVLDVQSKDARTHQLMLGVGFRFGK